MQKRLKITDQAQWLLHRAGGEAKRLGNAAAGATHVLMCVSNDPPTLAGYILRDLGLRIEEVRSSLDAALRNPDCSGSPDSVDRITDDAVLHAERMGSGFVSTEHILLAALQSGDVNIRRALEERGVPLEAAIVKALAIAKDVAEGRAPRRQ